jgi:hypothetical protein
MIKQKSMLKEVYFEKGVNKPELYQLCSGCKNYIKDKFAYFLNQG